MAYFDEFPDILLPSFSDGRNSTSDFSKSKNLFLNRLKWDNDKDCTLQCKGQGQEYVLNAEDNPKIIAWALSLIERHC